DGDELRQYWLAASPIGMSINASTGLISWTPSAAGRVRVTVKASFWKSATATQSYFITVTAANQPPQVNAGLDQTVTLPGTATLVGSATDDGLPAGGTLATRWAMRSGPAGGSMTFGDPTALNTTASFSAPGLYVLRLTATDGGGLSNSDDAIMTVAASRRFGALADRSDGGDDAGCGHSLSLHRPERRPER